MAEFDRSRTRDPEDVVSVIAVLILVVGIVWLILAREKAPEPSALDPFALPGPAASTTVEQAPGS